MTIAIIAAANALCEKLRESVKPIGNTQFSLIPMARVEEILPLLADLEERIAELAPILNRAHECKDDPTMSGVILGETMRTSLKSLI